MENLKELDGIVNIVVIVKNENVYKWYCSDKEYWIMDYAKYAKEFDPLDDDFSQRFGIGILDEFTKNEFLERMKQFEASYSQLQYFLKKLLPVQSYQEVYHIFPKLFIDFDSKRLYSVYSELLQLENYTPSGWIGEYEEFYFLIPQESKYWIIDNQDYWDLIR